MTKKKIIKLENKIKEAHLHPIISKHSASKKDAQETFRLFWSLHLKPVIDMAKELAEKYDADIEIAWLSAILHDIARLDDLEPHDEIGSEKAYILLTEEGFDKKTAEEVRDTILTHRVKQHKPKTLEQKILATADAMSHFKTPFYLWFSSMSAKPFKEQLESSLKKIERDYDDKIFFEDERKLIRPEYQILKKWCNYYSRLEEKIT